MLARSTLCPARAFANRYPPAIIAPLSSATASFSTCIRPSTASQSQSSPFATRRALPSRLSVRSASSATSQPAAGAPPTSQPQLTWNDFFALRRTRRRIGQGCSVVGAVGVTYYGLTTMMSNGYDATLSAQLGGLDPFMLMGLSTLGMLAVGWLIGPIFGNQVFSLAYRGVLAEFTAVSLLIDELSHRDQMTNIMIEGLRLLQPHQASPSRPYGLFPGQPTTRLLRREDWQRSRIP
jgi:import inner membrane translocase subunit TIM23